MLALVGVAGLVAGAAAWAVSAGEPTSTVVYAGVPVTRYAHEDEPWAPDYFRDLIALPGRPDLVVGARMRDHRGRFITIEDGRRVTYRPPDPEVTVWFFGGSTMFGLGQRDDGTIPSQVVHAAESDGLRIDALNFGVSSDVNWSQTVRFIEALDSSLPRPDLVVFYDGNNEWALADIRIDDGVTDPSEFDRMPVSDDERRHHRDSGAGTPPVPADRRDDLRVELGAAPYRRGVELARDLAADRGIDIVHFWQPLLVSKRLGPADDPLLDLLAFDPRSIPELRSSYARTREASGVDPVDLSGALDDAEVPVYFDFVHTNERGAQLIARAMYAELAPRLRQLAADRS